jgi:hypothetical protein
MVKAMEGMKRYRKESVVMPDEGDNETWMRSSEESSGVVGNGMRESERWNKRDLAASQSHTLRKKRYNP